MYAPKGSNIPIVPANGLNTGDPNQSTAVYQTITPSTASDAPDVPRDKRAGGYYIPGVGFIANNHDGRRKLVAIAKGKGRPFAKARKEMRGGGLGPVGGNRWRRRMGRARKRTTALVEASPAVSGE